MNQLQQNPLKEARLELNLTQSQLAGLADITPNALIKYEQGLYPEPSLKIITALVEAADGDLLYSTRLFNSYYDWRAQKVIAARLFFKQHRVVNGLNPTGGLNPFICWRAHHLHIASRLEFCKLLVLHPAVVQKYEEGQMRHMPDSISNTLLAVGVGKDSIDFLDYLGERYYDRIHNLTPA